MITRSSVVQTTRRGSCLPTFIIIRTDWRRSRIRLVYFLLLLQLVKLLLTSLLHHLPPLPPQLLLDASLAPPIPTPPHPLLLHLPSVPTSTLCHPYLQSSPWQREQLLPSRIRIIIHTQIWSWLDNEEILSYYLLKYHSLNWIISLAHNINSNKLDFSISDVNILSQQNIPLHQGLLKPN